MSLIIVRHNRVFIGEGNGNLLQYSCLENPRDRGAWWAAVHRVAQSQTWLKWLRMHTCTGEGNDNTLQYSCLESPRDGGVWWAAIYGVTQSRTRLKRLSSSSSSISPSNECSGLILLQERGPLPGPETGLLSNTQKWKLFSHVWFIATPWTVTHQAPLSMEFSRQEYWSGLPFPSPVDLPDPGIKPRSPALQADSLSSEPPEKPRSLSR